uniref:TIGR00282 family metallophosphoesterase n=1 Tax=candidate division WOR-3 bacterium TaxID=2052148 RepID=A0A7C4CC52_UNCW3
MPANRILFLGDICGEPGRQAVKELLPVLRSELKPDFVFANCENAAAGYGITPRLAEELLDLGIDCLTTGDHAFDRREAWPFFDTEPRLLRPLNLPPQSPGRGVGLCEKNGKRVALVNAVGRVFMRPAECPFQAVVAVLDELGATTPVVVVDFHAEATAEKQGMGWYLAGRVSAVIGTHTHVQTADERVLAGGTAYISDAGMCGGFDSILGAEKELSLRRLIDLMPARLRPAAGEPGVNGVLVEVDCATGRAQSITRVNRLVPAAS